MDQSVDNGVESLSIEETNAIRLKLGLKPLAVKSSGKQAEPKAPQARVESDENEDLHEARKSLIDGGSIADMLKRGEKIAPPALAEENEDCRDSAQPDLKAWARRMATIAARNRISALSYSDDETEDGPPVPSKPAPTRKRERAKLKVLHKVDDLGLDKGNGVVLTLADVGVLEAEAAGVADVDFLENPELPSKGLIKKGAKATNFDYNPYDDDEEDEDMIGGKPDILRKYDKTIDEYKGTKLNTLATGKKGFYVNVDEETAPQAKRPNTMLTQPTEESFSFEGLQRKKDLLKNRQKAVNWDKVFKSAKNDTNDDLHDDDGNHCSQIVKNAAIDTEDVEDCNNLYKQLSKHRNRILATVKPEKSFKINHNDVKTSLIDTGMVKEESKGMQLNSTSEFIHVVKPKVHKEETVAEQENSVVHNSKEQDEAEEDKILDPEGEVDNNVPMTMGIAEALSYLKDKGDLIEEKKDLDDVGKDIKLQYIDEYGRRMTPKEAFRKISWKFHGKGPGMNKQERKIKRIERERMAKQNPLEGLPTVKALLTHQMETKSSHLVLSGSSNIS